jgi:hypothetical protein
MDMRILVAAAIFAALTVSALAQGQGFSKMGGANLDKSKADQADAEKKKETEELEKSYKNTLKRIPEQSSKKDPWGSMR